MLATIKLTWSSLVIIQMHCTLSNVINSMGTGNTEAAEGERGSARDTLKKPVVSQFCKQQLCMKLAAQINRRSNQMASIGSEG